MQDQFEDMDCGKSEVGRGEISAFRVYTCVRVAYAFNSSVYEYVFSFVPIQESEKTNGV